MVATTSMLMKAVSPTAEKVARLRGGICSGDADPAPPPSDKAEEHVDDRRPDRSEHVKQQFLVRSAFYSNCLRLFLGMLCQIPELRVSLLD